MILFGKCEDCGFIICKCPKVSKLRLIEVPEGEDLGRVSDVFQENLTSKAVPGAKIDGDSVPSTEGEG